MILLDKKDYYKVLEPLREVTINHLFAKAVIEKHVSSSIYVDNVENPTSFYVCHPYGMSLLFGDSTHEAFNAWLLSHALNSFNTRDRYEWLQVFPDTWNELIATSWKKHLVLPNYTANDSHNSIEVNTRVNFRFNKTTYLDFKRKNQHPAIKAYRTDKHMFGTMPGTVIPNRFWDNADDFMHRAVAFSVLENDEVASTAFSAFVIDHQLEIGIETADGFRGKGYAIVTCSALIDYCIDHDYEPVWACRLDNTASYQLAQKLGFEPTVYWPFYRLSD